MARAEMQVGVSTSCVPIKLGYIEYSDCTLSMRRRGGGLVTRPHMLRHMLKDEVPNTSYPA